MMSWIWIVLGAGLVIIIIIRGKTWLDHHIYIKDGYNKLGYDRNGFDRDGYDQYGYNIKGFNREGYNKKGYDVDGYNKEGLNEFGLNREQYERRTKMYGNPNVYNILGYNYLGYDRNGLDEGENDKNYYVKVVSNLELKQNSAYRQLNEHEFRYALSDIRVGLEMGVKAILDHRSSPNIKKLYENSQLDYMIGFCEKTRLVKKELAQKLYSAKKHCNDILHGDSEKNVDQVFFCYKVLCELTETLKKQVGLTD